jgi:bacteriocin biosynthesis cyclodehydratase domain-containing protein
MHALLTPGSHVLRRSRDEVQVGLGPSHAVRVPADPADGSPPLHGDAAAPVRARLVAAGQAAEDDRCLREALPQHTSEHPWPRHTVAALFRQDPVGMAERVAARRRHEVTVQPFGHPLGRSLARDLEELCRRTDLPLLVDRAPGPPRKDAPPRHPLHVLVGVGEPRRDLLDPLVRDGVPHLLVRMVEGDAVVGPFVVPGSTPCLRCLDAHRAALDPAWPLLVEQYAQAASRDRPDGVPEPVDAALAALAVAWAARDVATYAGGGRPPTLATTVRVSPALEALETQPWTAHPACGCAWT